MSFHFPINPVSLEEVTQAINKSNLAIEERFNECGFVYFPASSNKNDSVGEGRVFWEADWEKDTISISPSRGFTTSRQRDEILRTLALYVTFKRQVRAAA